MPKVMLKCNVNRGGFKRCLKKCSQRIMGMINAFALLLVMRTANSACIWVAYQPEFPKEAEAFTAKSSSETLIN